jgi:hypothetical protein
LGLWDHFVASRSSEGLAAALPQAQPLGRHGEWEFARLPLDGTIETEDAVSAVVGALDAPAIGAYVLDSDSAAIYFAEPSGVAGYLAINRSYDDSDDDHTEQWLDPGAHRAAAEKLARWAAASTEAKPRAEAIVAALAALEDGNLGSQLGERHILFAEDGVRAVFADALGLPSLDDTVFSVD